MDYNARFIEGLTIADIEKEISEMEYRDYCHGCGIDRVRLWDLEYTKKILQESGVKTALNKKRKDNKK